MPALIFRALVAIALLVSPALASAQGLRVMARVNDDAITDYELNQRIVFAVRSTGMQDSPELHQRLTSQILRNDRRGCRSSTPRGWGWASRRPN